MATDLPRLQIPPGYGLSYVPPEKCEDFFDKLLMWEPPRKDQLYVLSADIGGGLGLDRSVLDVTRVGTIAEPAEQVAQFVSATIDPIDFAYPIDVVGRLYTGADGLMALAAIECNNHGLATQAELQRHLGYDNFYVWQHEDAADPKNRFSRAIGWYTTRRTRPIIIVRYVKRVKTVDPHTGLPDYRINSMHTLAELRDFQVPPDGNLWDAEADPSAEDAHDDCVMAGAIGIHVEHTLMYEMREPLPDQRRRRTEELARRAAAEDKMQRGYDWNNTDATEEEMRAGDFDGEDGMGGWGYA